MAIAEAFTLLLHTGWQMVAFVNHYSTNKTEQRFLVFSFLVYHTGENIFPGKKEQKQNITQGRI